MKNEILKLLNSENDYLKINKFCSLHRWQKDALGYSVDCLKVEISLTHAFSHCYTITARDWREIVEEVKNAQTQAFKDAVEELNKQLANGRLG